MIIPGINIETIQECEMSATPKHRAIWSGMNTGESSAKVGITGILLIIQSVFAKRHR